MSVADCHQMSPQSWNFGQSSATPYRTGSALAPPAASSAASTVTAVANPRKLPSLWNNDSGPAYRRPPGGRRSADDEGPVAGALVISSNASAFSSASAFH